MGEQARSLVKLWKKLVPSRTDHGHTNASSLGHDDKPSSSAGNHSLKHRDRLRDTRDRTSSAGGRSVPTGQSPKENRTDHGAPPEGLGEGPGEGASSSSQQGAVPPRVPTRKRKGCL